MTTWSPLGNLTNWALSLSKRKFLDYTSRSWVQDPIISPLYYIIHSLSSLSPSLSLRCEMRRWGTSDESGRLCTLCSKQVQEFEYHTLIQCYAFDHIRPCFPHIFDQAKSLHEFLSQPQCALLIATFNDKVLEHRDFLHTYHMKCNIFGLIDHIWPRKTIIQSLSLSLSLSLPLSLSHTCSYCIIIY